MLLLMRKTMPIWIFLQLGFGVVSTKRLFLMLRSSIQMLPVIGIHRSLLCTTGSRKINNGSIQGAWSHRGSPANNGALDLALAEGQVNV